MPHVRHVSVVATTLALLVSLATVTPSARAQDPGVQWLERKVTTAGAKPFGSRWIGQRITSLTAELEATCLAPALAKTPASGRELVIKTRLRRNGRLDATSVRPPRGAVPAPLSGCIRRLFAKTRIDMEALPPIEHDPDLPGAYYDPPGDPPEARDLPLRIEVRLALWPPPPPKTCGTSPAGCARKGCPSGLVCDTAHSCKPSSCTCDTETGDWICTRDCGGGVCVPPPR